MARIVLMEGVSAFFRQRLESPVGVVWFRGCVVGVARGLGR